MHSRHHIFYLLHTSDAHAHSGCLFGCGREGNKTSGRPSEGALTESQPAALGLGESHSVGETPPTHPPPGFSPCQFWHLLFYYQSYILRLAACLTTTFVKRPRSSELSF